MQNLYIRMLLFYSLVADVSTVSFGTIQTCYCAVTNKACRIYYPRFQARTSETVIRCSNFRVSIVTSLTFITGFACKIIQQFFSTGNRIDSYYSDTFPCRWESPFWVLILNMKLSERRSELWSSPCVLSLQFLHTPVSGSHSVAWLLHTHGLHVPRYSCMPTSWRM